MRPQPLQSLTAFQRDLLIVLAGLDEPNGLEAKAELEEEYGEDINKPRWYDNLGQLVDAGLVEKRARTRVENAYMVTEKGREALAADLDWRERSLED